MLVERRVFPMSGRVERVPLTVTSNNTNNPMLHHITIDGFAVGVIGMPMVLREKYDPKQEWLPFVSAITLHPPPEPQRPGWQGDDIIQYNYHRILGERLNERTLDKIAEQRREFEEEWVDDMIHPEEEDRKLFFWPGDWAFDQFPLPFVEAKEVEERSEFAKVSHLWDRLGELEKPLGEDEEEEDKRPHLTLSVRGVSRATLAGWLRQNCVGRFYIPSGGHRLEVEVTLERTADWLFAKLRFDGKDRFEEFDQAEDPPPF